MKQGISQVFVLDPTYNANKKRAIEILDYIANAAPNIFFHFECRAEVMDKELARAFSKINCCLQIGLQSCDENVLAKVNRTFNKTEFVKKIAILNEVGLVFGFDLIYGLPGDTLHGFEQSVNFALSLYPNHLELFCLSVLPGTDLYDRFGELHLTFEKTPPYHVIKTDKISENEIEKCRKLAESCNIFYSNGRGVSWFNSVLHFFKMNAVNFLVRFDDFLSLKFASDEKEKKSLLFCGHEQIEKLQIEFIEKLLAEKNLKNYTDLICDIIKINGAYSRCYADGKTSFLKLHYHPEDLLSEYSQNIRFFYQNAKKGKFNIHIKNGKNGVTWTF